MSSTSSLARGRVAVPDHVLLSVSGHLTSRDRALVRTVGEHRVLTTGQLSAMYFGSITTARHRLAVLVGLGLLRRFRPHREVGSAPGHYLLGPVGAALLGAEDRDERRWLPQVRADRQLALARSQRLAHMTGVNWFFAALAARARRGGGELLEWLNEVQAATRCQQRVVLASDDLDKLPHPDGMGTWAQDGQQVTFWLEHDTGTETLSRLADKLSGYSVLAAGLAKAGQACPPLLFCLPGPRREQAVRRTLAGSGHAHQLRIATTALDPQAACPAGPVWLPLGQASGQLRLIDLAALADPWQRYRDELAQRRREAADAECARLLEAGYDEQDAAALAAEAVDRDARFW